MKYYSKNIIYLFICALCVFVSSKNAVGQTVQMVFTSDAHYGIIRAKFRGDTAVPGYVVNAALIKQINSLPGLVLPADSGVNQGQLVSGIDYVIEGGDIANRMEVPIQSAATSWAQFKSGYIGSLLVKGHNGKPAELLIVPGNHDISNAIGYSKLMSPLKDPTSMVNIYNLMLKPATLLTNEKYNYATDKINYSRNIHGVHFTFINLWPDSAERVWIKKDLDTVAATTPVIIFTHDQPECESKHFTNPLPPYNMTPANKFENLTAEHYKESITAAKDAESTAIEQRGFTKFLKAHRNIVAYFHGNSNWNEFYTYHGPDNDVSLKVFRVDSPMKGKYSSKDETKLSFQLITLDAKNKLLTVRECLWNTTNDTAAKVVVGNTMTVSLKTD